MQEVRPNREYQRDITRRDRAIESEDTQSRARAYTIQQIQNIPDLTRLASKIKILPCIKPMGQLTDPID